MKNRWKFLHLILFLLSIIYVFPISDVAYAYTQNWTVYLSGEGDKDERWLSSNYSGWIDISLTNIPQGSDFDLYLYEYPSYELVDYSKNSGNANEDISYYSYGGEEYIVEVYCYEGSGSALLTATWPYDTTPPSNVSIDQPNDWINYTKIPVSLSASDNESGVAEGDVDVRINSGPWSHHLTTTFNFDYDGEHGKTYEFQFRAKDNAGNWSGFDDDGWCGVDTAGPSVTITNPANGDILQGNTTINFSASDSHSGVNSYAISIDNSPVIYSNSYSWNTTSYSEGLHTIVCYACDKAGNSSNKSIQVNIDNQPPSITITSPTQAYTNQNSVYISFTASDPSGLSSGIPYAIYINGKFSSDYGDSNPFDNVFNWTSPPEGNHTIICYAWSVLEKQTSQSKAITVDRTPPVVTISSPSNNQIVSGAVNINFSASDSLSGLAISNPYAIYIDDFPKAYSNSYSWDTTSYSEGLHTIVCYAYDKAGNSSNKSIQVNIDNQPPSITITSPTQAYTNQNSVYISFTASDPSGLSSGIPYAIYIDGKFSSDYGDLNPFDNLFNWTSPSEGNHTIVCYAWSVLERQASQSKAIVVDRTPPVVTISSPSNNQIVSGAVNINFSASDSLSGLAISNPYAIYIDGFPVDYSNSYSWNTTSYSEGWHTITCYAYDKATNQGYKTISVYVDNPPKAPTGLIATAGIQSIALNWNANTESDCDGYFVMMSRNSNITPTNYERWYWVSGRLNISYTFTDLTERITYYFIVTATNYGGNESEALTKVSAVPLAPEDKTPPLTPTNLTVTNHPPNDDGTHLNLTWTASTDNKGVAYYRVYESTSPNVSKSVYDYYYEPITTSLLAHHLTAGQKYYYRVSAVDTSGNESQLSNRAEGVPKDTRKPNPPTGLSAVGNDGNVSLSWNYNDVSGHKIYRKVEGGSYQQINQIGWWNYYTDYDIVNGTTYNYKITALNIDNVESGYSNEVTAKPIAVDTTPPAVPTGLSAYPHDKSAVLNWNRNTESDLVGYNVYRNGIKVNTSLVTWNYYENTGLSNGITYRYKITAVDTHNNESGYSIEESVTPLATLEITGFSRTEPDNPKNGLFDPEASESIKIYFSMDNPYHSVTLRIYDETGNVIYSQTILRPEDCWFSWDGKDAEGNVVCLDSVTFDIEGVVYSQVNPAPQFKAEPVLDNTLAAPALNKGIVEIYIRSRDAIIKMIWGQDLPLLEIKRFVDPTGYWCGTVVGQTMQEFYTKLPPMSVNQIHDKYRIPEVHEDDWPVDWGLTPEELKIFLEKEVIPKLPKKREIKEKPENKLGVSPINRKYEELKNLTSDILISLKKEDPVALVYRHPQGGNHVVIVISATIRNSNVVRLIVWDPGEENIRKFSPDEYKECIIVYIE